MTRSSSGDPGQNLQATYANRFSEIEAERNNIWRVLAGYFQRWVKPTDSVLDIGAGYCEFINNIQAQQKTALDLNPFTAAKAASDVQVVLKDVCQVWPIASDTIDFAFSSNFFEHLPTKESLRHCFVEIRRVLRPGGMFIAMGPNIRFAFDVYWDFFDHYLPLSDRSVAEGLAIEGLQIERVIPRFLPYTMARSRPPSPFFVKLYLRMPVAWHIFGKQFLIMARKPHDTTTQHHHPGL